jgi:hypothetical protein
MDEMKAIKNLLEEIKRKKKPIPKGDCDYGFKVCATLARLERYRNSDASLHKSQ